MPEIHSSSRITCLSGRVSSVKAIPTSREGKSTIGRTLGNSISLVKILSLLVISGGCGRVTLGAIRERGGSLNFVIEHLSTLLRSQSIPRASFVTAPSVPTKCSRSLSTSATSSEHTMTDENVEADLCLDHSALIKKVNRYSFKGTHSKDSNFWLYHIENTTSTMDEAKRLVEQKFLDANACLGATMEADISSEISAPKSFLISATSQSSGRGTTKRKWESHERGNSLFTIGIQQSSWISDLKTLNEGRAVPLTLLPLKVGSIVASHIQKQLNQCFKERDSKSENFITSVPKVILKWPNDVLVLNPKSDSQNVQASYEKIAGILIESSHDWFLIGIGVNVGYAPDIRQEGIDYGRRATSLSSYCTSSTSTSERDWKDQNNVLQSEEYWINISKELAINIAFDLHSWLHPNSMLSLAQRSDSILHEWKSYVDWDMELTLRDTPKRERVQLKRVLDDGRVVVQEIDTGLTRTLVSDYFL